LNQPNTALSSSMPENVIKQGFQQGRFYDGFEVM
jgi:hypothetical protein